MRQHKRFISQSVVVILEQMLSTLSTLPNTIEVSPLIDYLRDAVFLRMTGFIEQKLKCIMWELASDDFEFRYKNLYQEILGECSSFSDKNKVYKNLVFQIRKRKPDFLINSQERREWIKVSKSEMERLFNSTAFKTCMYRQYLEYQELLKYVSEGNIATDNGGTNISVLSGDINQTPIKEYYENHLYRLRNRVAHNTKSYQENTPSLRSMQSINSCWDNYFFHYFWLIVIDTIFVKTFEMYLDSPSYY